MAYELWEKDAEKDADTVLGYMIYELFPNKISIPAFATHTDYRRKGVGTAMVEKLISKLSTHRRQEIVLKVRESNLEAQLFFRHQGFRSVGVLKNFYEDTSEDAYLMAYSPYKELGLNYFQYAYNKKPLLTHCNRISQYFEAT